MKILKSFTLTILTFSFLANCASAQTKGNKNVDKKDETQRTVSPRNKIKERKPPQPATEETAANIKTLAEGADASVTTPFVFVARTPEGFALLKKLVTNLPNEKIDFNRTAVVAAFAGTKNTGGYSLQIAGNANKVSVKIIAPPKDAMVTQSLTTPYKVALVEVEQENSLNLDLLSDFSKTAKNYHVTSGEFEFSGGFAGIHKKFAAQGTVRVLSFGEYVTLIFNLTGKDGESKRKLYETASGTLKNEKINIARLEAGDFIDRPHPFMTVSGNSMKDKLSLAFLPGQRDYVVNDGFAGGGKLEALETK